METEKLRITVQNGAMEKRAFVRMFYGNTPFNNTIPPGYSPVIVKDFDYPITCHQNLPFRFDVMLIFFIDFNLD